MTDNPLSVHKPKISFLTFSNSPAVCLRNISNAQGREKEITTQGERKKAKREGGGPFLKILISLSALHLHSQEAVSTRAYWINAALTPQLHLILTSDLHKPHIWRERKQANLNYQATVYLWSGYIRWVNSSPSTSTTVSPPLGYQMCLAHFGMRHAQINTLPRGATVESPRWVSKKNIQFYLHSLLFSQSCLDVVVYSGSGPLYPCLALICCNKVKFHYVQKK